MTDNVQLKSSIDAVFAALKEKLDTLLVSTDTHIADTSNPHAVTKAQVGLGELPNAITSLRTINSEGSLLTAKGIFDHVASDDHDARYYTKTLADAALALKVDISSIVDNLTSTSTDVPLSAAQGKVLKDAVDQINALINSDDTTLNELQEIVDYIKLNRADLDNLSIASISGLGTALNDKVDKVTGKALSENDFTDALLTKLNSIQPGAESNINSNLSVTRSATSYVITNSNGTGFVLDLADAVDAGLMSPAQFTKLSGIAAGAQVNPTTTASRTSTSTTSVLQAAGMNNHRQSADHDARYYTQTQLDASLNGKVDKISGKGLSSEDYTAAEKTKLSGIAAGAQVNVNTNLSLGGSGNARTIVSSTGSNVALPVSSSTTAGLMSIANYDKLIGVEVGAQVNVSTNLDKSVSSGTITITNSNGTNVVLPSATTAAAGLLTSADKTKLNSVQSGAQPNVDTNLSLTGTGDSLTLASSTGSNVAVPVVTTTDAGFMSIGDKSKLNGIAAGAQVNVGTDLGVNRAAGSVTITSSTGSNTSIGSATVTLAGWMSSSDKTKLDGVEAGAEVNVNTDLAVGGSGNNRTITSSTGVAATVPVASTTDAGFQSIGDKSKLNSIETGAEVNQPTTASRTSSATTTILQAKAMNDHRTSGDHDSQYVTKSGDSTVTGIITAADFVYSSDESLKEAIESIGPVSEKLTRLLAKQYIFKDDPERRVRFGFLAHEAAEVFPELLRYREDDKKALAYTDIIPLLVQGFNEKSTELDEMKVEMAGMQNQIDQLFDLLTNRQ